MTQEFWNGSIGGEKHSHPRLISRVVERPKPQPADRWPTEVEDAKPGLEWWDFHGEVTLSQD